MGRTRRLSPSSRICAISSAKVMLVPDISPPATPTVQVFLRALRASSVPPSSSSFGTAFAAAGVGAPTPSAPTPIIAVTNRIAKYNAPHTDFARITPPSGTQHNEGTVTPAFADIVIGFRFLIAARQTGGQHSPQSGGRSMHK